MGWVVAATRNGHERRAQAYLLERDVISYLPQFWDKERKRIELLFASYILVWTQELAQWTILKSTWGVKRVIMAASRPAILPDDFVYNLKRKEKNGLVRMDPEQPPLVAGLSRVRLKDCPLQGALGIYQGQTTAMREKVLLDQLGFVVVASDQLEHA